MSNFAVSSNGQSVQMANGPQQLLSMNKPFPKLDVTFDNSFQTIQLLFNNEPPQPATVGGYTNTQVYSFPHPYGYPPKTWTQWQNPSPVNASPGPGSSATTFYTFGDESNGVGFLNDQLGVGPTAQPPSLIGLTSYNTGSSITFTTQASLITTADKDKIYISVLKEAIGAVAGAVVPLYLIGVTLFIRVYVFTEPANTSTY